LELPTIPHDLARALAQGGARLGPLADGLSWFAEVSSTNDVALARADAGAPEGTVIAAEAQTRGRGRLGRAWASPAGAGVYASVILRPATHASLITLAAGVAVADGVEAATGLRVCLKWPNDICLPGPAGPGRKLGGILTEGGSSTGGAVYVVVGLGINVRRSPHPPGVALRAVAIEEELGRPVDRDLVLVESLAALWQRYTELRSGRAAAVLEAWRGRARSTFGRRVEWGVPGGSTCGVSEGIDDTGALLGRTPSGVVPIISGEVRWV
jgi:BirA family biotin operon repressor/biotin-[acetyl-CoA-carboxylase] ligase